MSPHFHIAPATANDVPAILGLIRGIAEYEHLSHEVVATEALLRESLFGPKPAAEVLLAWAIATTNDAAGKALPQDAAPLGYAVFFGSFSTFLGRPGIYLEDLFVLPAYRGQGIGRALFRQVAQIAVAREAGRLEWSVLDWNEPALKFYRSQGAQPLTEWTVQRLTGEALARVATKHS
jgi:GNAT superfamily N-acetyltransferase